LSTQENNTVVQTQNQSISTRTKKSTTDNATHNEAELVHKIAQCNPSNKEIINQFGKKDKVKYTSEKELTDSNSRDESGNDIQDDDDKTNNINDDDNNNSNRNNDTGDNIS